jgi:hypothetical protein
MARRSGRMAFAVSAGQALMVAQGRRVDAVICARRVSDMAADGGQQCFDGGWERDRLAFIALASVKDPLYLKVRSRTQPGRNFKSGTSAFDRHLAPSKSTAARPARGAAW